MVRIFFLLVIVGVAGAKEPFCKSFDPTGSPMTVFVLPPNKSFTLLQLYLNTDNDLPWTLNGGPNLALSGQIEAESYIYNPFQYMYSFPDGIAVVPPGESLIISGALKMIIVGYFDDACPTSLQSDLTGDCIVDFKDFAVFAEQWLSK